MALIYTSPDDLRPNRDRMKELDVYDFLGMYIPISNDQKPFNHPLNEVLGNVVWHKHDYALLGNYLSEKSLWVVNEDAPGEYSVCAGIRISDQTNLVGYIITSIPYHRNDIGNLRIKIILDEV